MAIELVYPHRLARADGSVACRLDQMWIPRGDKGKVTAKSRFLERKEFVELHGRST